MTKTVLVTGATGFLGSHLVKGLLAEGYCVAILKRSFSKMWRIDKVLSQLESFDLDSCNLEQVFHQLGKVFAIIHTATCYGKNGESPFEVFSSNTIFPLQLLEYAVKFDVDIFVNTDTYFNKGDVPYQGLPDYSLSKRHFTDWGKQYAHHGKILFFNIKLEHIFGGCEDESKFTSYVIRNCLRNGGELSLTEGKQLRDFIYVRDVVTAYIKLLKQAKQSRTYQEYELGCGKAVTIREFVETVHNLTQSNAVLKFGAIPYSKDEIMFSQSNLNEMYSLGWIPKYSLHQGLLETISEYRGEVNL